MAKVKCLMVDVLKHRGESAANGGISDEHDAVLLVCPDGPLEVDTDDPRMVPVVQIVENAHGTIRAVPFPQHAGGLVGPMMGGSYIASPDSRFGAVCRRRQPNFYGAVALHDRYETKAEYEALSR
jgi:hypothetical protein